MNQKSPLFGLLVTIGILALIYVGYYSFFKSKDKIIIDNPTANQIQIKIDNEVFIVGKEQSISVGLEKGKHQFQYELDGKKIDTIVELNQDFGVINPTKTTYYIFKRPYGVEENIDSLFKNQSVEIDDKNYFGNIKPTNQFWINEFSVGLDKDYPKLVKKPNKDSLTSISKIFRKEEFKQFYYENYE